MSCSIPLSLYAPFNFLATSSQGCYFAHLNSQKVVVLPVLLLLLLFSRLNLSLYINRSIKFPKKNPHRLTMEMTEL